MPSQEEQRRAARIKFHAADHLEVHYKFLTHLEDYQCDQIFKGVVANLSKGGALFVGPIPGPEWLEHLNTGSVLIGLNIMSPEDRIKALTSLRWTQPVKAHEYGLSQDEPCYELGVRFEQIDPLHRNTLSKFLIGHQMRTGRQRREPAD